MINLINGSLKDPQENIRWVENKSSALIVLNTHTWSIGETLIVGYKSKRDDIMIGVGIKNGVGSACYRVIVDKSIILVAEVLRKVPDVSYYVFDQRYMILEEDGIYITTRRYDKENSEIKTDKVQVLDKCIVIETSNGNIWICNPPSIVNFFNLANSLTFDVSFTDDGLIKLDLTTNEVTYRDLCFVSPEEKIYLRDEIFEKNFNVEITSKTYDALGNETSSTDPCVVAETIYTLTSTYYGENVDLDETPDGWIREDTGVYSKTAPGNTTTSVGPVTCGFTKDYSSCEKVIPEITTVIDKYIFIIYSPRETLFEIKTADKIFLSPSPSLGRMIITPPQDNYTWFAFPISMLPSEITQIGVNYIYEKATGIITGVFKDNVNIGDYIVCRSLNPGNGLEQEINIR